jgi:hypothetical protein
MQLISGATYGDDIMTTFTTSRDDVLRRQARNDDCGLMAIAVSQRLTIGSNANIGKTRNGKRVSLTLTWRRSLCLF